MCTILCFLAYIFFAIPIYIRGEEISCVCTTTHCREQQVSTCNTTSMCFSQYLDRKDGSDPVVKGCISSKTPLLCENRRPALHHRANWPILSCCNKNLCNRNVEPTPSSIQQKTTEGDGKSASPVTSNDPTADVGHMAVTKDNEIIVEGKASQIFNSIYIIVLVVGICSLLLIGGIAALVLRRQSALYDQEFGSIHRNGYLKGESGDINNVNLPPKPGFNLNGIINCMLFFFSNHYLE